METQRQTKPFHIGDVLSLTTGRLVAPRSLEGLYELLRYLTGDEPATSELKAVAHVCGEYLVAYHPDLRDVNVDGVDTENWRQWLEQQVQLRGQFVEVEKPLPGEIVLP